MFKLHGLSSIDYFFLCGWTITLLLNLALTGEGMDIKNWYVFRSLFPDKPGFYDAALIQFRIAGSHPIIETKPLTYDASLLFLGPGSSPHSNS